MKMSISNSPTNDYLMAAAAPSQKSFPVRTIPEGHNINTFQPTQFSINDQPITVHVWHPVHSQSDIDLLETVGVCIATE